MKKYQFLMSGSGGQGVISMAILLAEAVVVYEGRNATQSQSYGPEARGGSTRSDVIISDAPIYYPKAVEPNYLVVLTNEAMRKYLSLIRPGGMCIYDPDMVQINVEADVIHKPLRVYQAVMDVIGKPQALNVVVLGALSVLTGAARLESLEKVLEDRFAPMFHANNKKALYLGAELAQPLVDNEQ